MTGKNANVMNADAVETVDSNVVNPKDNPTETDGSLNELFVPTEADSSANHSMISLIDAITGSCAYSPQVLPVVTTVANGSETLVLAEVDHQKM